MEGKKQVCYFCDGAKTHIYPLVPNKYGKLVPGGQKGPCVLCCPNDFDKWLAGKGKVK